MKTYLEHLMESDREYHFRIKSVVPLTDGMMEKIERVLTKYELRDIQGPTKTIIQHNPLDFYNIDNAEVYIVDAVVGVAQSSYILQQELRGVLGISENYIVVRGDNDPLEVESQRRDMAVSINSEAEKSGLKKASLLGTDEKYPEADHSISGDTFYGDRYNSEFLETLAQVAASRPSTLAEPKNGLFDWLNAVTDELQVADDNAFNANIKGAPKSVAWWEAKKTDVENDELELRRSLAGNFDNDFEEKHLEYENSKKERKTISAASKKVRD